MHKQRMADNPALKNGDRGAVPTRNLLDDMFVGERAPGQADEETVSADGFKFKPMTMREMLLMPPKRWIIDQVLGASDIAMVYGSPGSGKTFVIVDLLFAACLGQTWAMRFDVPKPLSVAYCAGEGISGLPSRFGAAAEHYDVEDLPSFTFYAVTPSLFCDERLKNDTESIERFVFEWRQRQDAGQAQPLDILIIDTLHSATAGADENSARDMGMVVDLCRKAARALGCAVILVHHSNKAGTGERGSSALRGAMDCMIEVKEASGKYAIECAKIKDGEKWKEQTFDLVAKGESVRIWWDEIKDGNQDNEQKSGTGPAIIALLNNVNGNQLTTKQIAEAIDAKPQTVTKVLHRLEKENKIKRGQTDRGTWCFSIPTEIVEHE